MEVEMSKKEKKQLRRLLMEWRSNTLPGDKELLKSLIHLVVTELDQEIGG